MTIDIPIAFDKARQAEKMQTYEVGLPEAIKFLQSHLDGLDYPERKTLMRKLKAKRV